MTMYDTFNVSRLIHLMKNDLMQQRKLIYIVAATVILFLVFLPFNTLGYPDAYFNILYIGGFVITSFAFNDLHDRSKAHLFLMLPCSNLERFLSKWLLTSIGYALGILVIYYVCSWLSAGIYFLVFKFHLQVLNIFDPRLWMGIWKYMILQSVILLGAILFKKYTLIKTALVTGCFILILSMFWLLVTSIFFFPDYSQASLLWQTSLQVGHLIFWVMLAPLCWYITYLRITEYELT